MSTEFVDSTDSGFDGDVSIAVVTAIATSRGVDPTDLPPLYEWVDPDALDALFEPTRSGRTRPGRVEFPYDGAVVTVELDEELEIRIDGSPVESTTTVATDLAGETGSNG